MSEAALPPATADPPSDASGTHDPQWRADLALVVAAFFFGTTFVVVQDAIEDVQPIPFLAGRFLIAALVLGFAARRRPATPHEIRHGVAAGLVLMAGYVLQTIGLQYTKPATSAFLTYLLVVLVPILNFALLRKRPHPATLVGIVLAVGGLVLLTDGGGSGLGKGELLTLGCAFGFALHLIVLGATTEQHDPVRLTFIQMATVGGSCLVVTLLGGDAGQLAMGRSAFAAAVFTGVFATAVAFLAMAWAQKTVSATRAALIFLMEPVFAAQLGWLTGDRLTPAQAAGGALILVAVLVSEVVPKLLTARSRSVRLRTTALRDQLRVR